MFLCSLYIFLAEKSEKTSNESESAVPLECILQFFSGARQIPPLGFSAEPELNFNFNNRYPTASTCAVQLTLPTAYSTYDIFKSMLTTGFLCHGGFGLD